jgi:hypothetical protein
MIAVEIVKCISDRKIRFLALVMVIAITAPFYAYPPLRELEPITLLDYFLLALTNSFNCMVILPIFFLFLTSDLLRSDVLQGYTSLTVIRMKSRFSWWLHKSCILFLCAFLFILLLFILYFLVGFCMGFPINWSWSAHSLFDSSNPWTILGMLAGLYVLSLAAIGVAAAVLALLMQSNLLSWGICSLFCFFSFVTWGHFPKAVPWMPTVQTMLIAQITSRYAPPFPGCSLPWAIGYNLTLLTVMLIVGGWVMRKINLSA